MGITVIIYVVLCLMVAYMGRKTKLGFYRTLLFSLMLTPLVMMVYLVIFESVEGEQRRREDRVAANRRTAPAGKSERGE